MEVAGTLTEEDLPRIEEEMRRISSEDIPVERLLLPREEALALFRERDAHYKLELISEIPDEFISIYRQGEFADLCRGPHIVSTAGVKHFKLLSVAGAYWRGDEKNIMLTVYGTALTPPRRSRITSTGSRRRNAGITVSWGKSWIFSASRKRARGSPSSTPRARWS